MRQALRLPHPAVFAAQGQAVGVRIFSALPARPATTQRMGFAGRTVPLGVMNLCPPTHPQNAGPAGCGKFRSPRRRKHGGWYSRPNSGIDALWASIRQGSSAASAGRPKKFHRLYAPLFQLAFHRRRVVRRRKRTTAFSLWSMWQQVSPGPHQLDVHPTFSSGRFQSDSQRAWQMTVGRLSEGGCAAALPLRRQDQRKTHQCSIGPIKPEDAPAERTPGKPTRSSAMPALRQGEGCTRAADDLKTKASLLPPDPAEVHPGPSSASAPPPARGRPPDATARPSLLIPRSTSTGRSPPGTEETQAGPRRPQSARGAPPGMVSQRLSVSSFCRNSVSLHALRTLPASVPITAANDVARSPRHRPRTRCQTHETPAAPGR